MKRIEDQLPSDIFIRVHRSYIVNIRMIKTITESSLDMIVGDNLINLPVGKSYRVQLMNYINVVDRNKPLL
jgi:DNA-binding LytR/AlgR family response regulator